MAWDDVDELVDHWTWAYYITGKVMESALLRYSPDVVPGIEDHDYRYQDHPEWWDGAAGLMAQRGLTDRQEERPSTRLGCPPGIL